MGLDSFVSAREKSVTSMSLFKNWNLYCYCHPILSILEGLQSQPSATQQQPEHHPKREASGRSQNTKKQSSTGLSRPEGWRLREQEC